MVDHIHIKIPLNNRSRFAFNVSWSAKRLYAVGCNKEITHGEFIILLLEHDQDALRYLRFARKKAGVKS